MGRPEEPAPEAEASDRSLLNRFREGNQDAAAEIYLRYANRLRALARAQCSPDLARKVEIEDIVQSVFGSFFRGAGQGYYEVPAGEELWKLFLVIALNKVRAKGAYHRAAKRDARRTAGGELLEEFGADDSDSAACAFLRLVIDEELGRLPESHQQIVRLRMEGHDVAEVARRVGRSKRSVERALQEFRERMADVLHEGG